MGRRPRAHATGHTGGGTVDVRRTGALVVAAVLLTLIVPAADAQVPPPSRVVSNYETATGNLLARDCGYSVPLPSDPGQALWIFCDTAQFDADGNPTPPALPFWPGSFAAVGPFTPGQVPTTLSHLPSPPQQPTLPNSDAPRLLLPNPTGLVDADGQPCLFSATWTLGVTQGPADSVTMLDGATPVTIADASSLVFLSFMHVCVSEDPDGNWHGLHLAAKRSGLAAYDPAANTMEAVSVVHEVADPTDELPWQQSLFHPAFDGNRLLLYGYICDTIAPAFGACTAGRAITARVPLHSLSDGTAYEWWTASGWSSDHTDADDILPPRSGLGTMALDVSDFTAQGKGFLLMEQLSMGGHYRIWQAPAPTGPWTEVRTGQMPGCPALAGYGCYHLWGHPHLSPAGALMYSYHDMQTGHLMLTTIDTVPDL